jgi:hypothetical protein
MVLTNSYLPAAPNGVGEAASRELPAAFITRSYLPISYLPFLTEKIQRCPVGYAFEMNMSGINF